jgi:hypothetical protein
MDTLGPIDYINSLLVVKGVRDAYLIQNFESSTDAVDERIQKIQEVFPQLKLLKNNNYYFLSLKSLNKADVDNDIKIAHLLRFSCDVDFKDLDRSKETVTYNIVVHIRGRKSPVTIITYICQTKSTMRDAQQLVSEIQKVLPDDKVVLDVDVNIPVISLVPKLMNPKYKFTKNEISELNNIIFNIMNESSYDRILGEIDYNNLLHRGIMLSYIAEHEHDTLQPFYPLQSSGHMKEVYQIEDEKGKLMEQILIDSKKSMKSKWFGGRRGTRKRRH